MSYDVHFEIDTGGEEPVEIAEYNYTYSCAPMFQLALGGEGINELGGCAGDWIEHLERAVNHMVHPDNEAIYKSMNPSNGWGDYYGAVGFLNNLLDAARCHPKTTIRVS